MEKVFWKHSEVQVKSIHEIVSPLITPVRLEESELLHYCYIMITLTSWITSVILFQKIQLSTSSQKWIGDMLKETFPPFTLSSASPQCLRDSLMYKTHFKNGTTWAVKMADSSASSVSGILNGNTHHFGNFDQCLSINVTDLNITGKYCLLKVQYWPSEEIFPNFSSNNLTTYKEPLPLSSVWEMLQITNDPRFQRRDIIYLGVCLPSSCSSNEIQQSIQEENSNTYFENSIRVVFNTSEENCSSRNENNGTLTTGFYIFICSILTLLIGVSIVTGIHVYNEAKNNYQEKWYHPLSALHNIRNLKKPVAKEYAPSCGLKVLSMFIVIYGHRHLFSLSTPLVNMYQNEKRFGQFWETYVLNGSIVVDTFFCASGFISFQKMISGIQKSKPLTYLTLHLVFRWIRITIMFLSTILFMVYVLPAVGSGPLWKFESYERSKICLKYWWVNLTYLGNFFHNDKLCLIPAWYLASDMQLFIMNVFLVYVYIKHKVMGKILLFSILWLSVMLPGIIVFTKRFHGIFRFYIRNLKDFYSDEEYLTIYSSTYSRSSPYVIGMVAAYFNMKMKAKHVILPFWLHVILAFSTLFITGGCILSAWPFYLPQHNYSTLENAVYAVLSKLFWAINMSWIVMANSVGGESLLSSKILSSKIFVILNRLTLCVLLIHTPLQFILIMTIRTPQYLTHLTNVWMAFGDIFISYLLSLIAYLLVEAPASGLLYAFIKKII